MARADSGRILRASAACVLASCIASGAGAQANTRSVSAPDTAAFYTWWVRAHSTDLSAEADTVGFRLPTGVRRIGLALATIRASTGVRRRPPLKDLVGKWRVGILASVDAEDLVVWVPDDSRELNRNDVACRPRRSWLSVVPSGQWLSVDLDPSCDETYGSDEVDFTLYWLGMDRWPHVQITTNGPACVPSRLYRFDPREQRYVEAREACAG